MQLYSLPNDILVKLIRSLPGSAATCLALTCHYFHTFILTLRRKKILKHLARRFTYYPAGTQHLVLMRLLIPWMAEDYVLCCVCTDIYLKLATRPDQVCSVCESKSKTFGA